MFIYKIQSNIYNLEKTIVSKIIIIVYFERFKISSLNFFVL